MVIAYDYFGAYIIWTYCVHRLGTVISINRTPENDFTQPIMARLRQRDTGLRVTADPSLLVQSLLDLSKLICIYIN